MTLYDLLDPIYDPTPTGFDGGVGTLEGDPVEGPWEPIDLAIGGEGGGE